MFVRLASALKSEGLGHTVVRALDWLRWKAIRAGDFLMGFLYPSLLGRSVHFPIESVSLTLPRFVPVNDFLSSFDFRKRLRREPLLRQVVKTLFDGGLLESDRNIIDIGCWLGDNALPWSHLLTEGAHVVGIDPSKQNINFVNRLAIANKLSNIDAIQALCSDMEGIAYFSDSSSIRMASFLTHKTRHRRKLTSTTLDEIYPHPVGSVGLLHIDVERMELEVLKGAERILEASLPVVIFEQHLGNLPSPVIWDFLVERGYEVFMLNEALHGNQPDNRNFIAVEREKVSFLGELIPDAFGSSVDFLRATPGPILIPVTPSQ